MQGDYETENKKLKLEERRLALEERKMTLFEAKAKADLGARALPPPVQGGGDSPKVYAEMQPVQTLPQGQHGFDARTLHFY